MKRKQTVVLMSNSIMHLVYEDDKAGIVEFIKHTSSKNKYEAATWTEISAKKTKNRVIWRIALNAMTHKEIIWKWEIRDFN